MGTSAPAARNKNPCCRGVAWFKSQHVVRNAGTPTALAQLSHSSGPCRQESRQGKTYKLSNSHRVQRGTFFQVFIWFSFITQGSHPGRKLPWPYCTQAADLEHILHGDECTVTTLVLVLPVLLTLCLSLSIFLLPTGHASRWLSWMRCSKGAGTHLSPNSVNWYA